MIIAGIYRIKNMVDGKLYIGSAVSMKKRWANHRTMLRSGKHPSRHLQAAWNRDGEPNFSFDVLEVVNNLAILLDREQEWINKTECLDQSKGYNLAPSAYSQLGFKHRADSRSKIGLIWKGKKMSPEHRAKLSDSRRGKKLSPEHCAAISNGQRGHHRGVGAKRSLEARMNIAKGKLGNTNGRGGRGRHHSEDTKRKLSEIRKAWWATKRQL